MKSTAASYLKHHFLIAMPHMADSNFAQTVTYLVEHNEQGAMGLIINRPSGLSLADVLEQLRPDELPPVRCQGMIIYNGGYRPTAASSCPPPGVATRPPWSWASCRCPPPRTCCSPSPTAAARRNT